MPDKLVTKIIDLCLEMDLKAAKLYKQFSLSFKETELQLFWKEMAEEEKLHINCWKGLLVLSQEGMIPQIFNNPKK